MTARNWVKRTVVGSMLTVVLPLAACSEVNQTLDSASGALDKAKACTEAIGIVTNFNPEVLSPAEIQQEAGNKAERLRELGNNVADANVQDTLFSLADGYVDLEKRQASALENVNGWVQNNVDKIDQLRQVCA